MRYEFPDDLQVIYAYIHEWLDNMDDTNSDFRSMKTNLDSDKINDVANEFHSFFAAHYFKVLSSLREIITIEKVESWIQDNNKICIIDVGCGTGASSIAFLEFIRIFLNQTDYDNELQIHLIGIDPKKTALEMYRTILDRFKKSQETPDNLKITHEIICGKILDVSIELQQKLEVTMSKWQQPSIPHTILLQVNVVKYPICEDLCLRQFSQHKRKVTF